WLFMFPEEAGREPNAKTEFDRFVTEVFSDDPFTVSERSQIVASSVVYPFAGVVDPGAIRPWYLVYRVSERELGIDLISQMKRLAVPLVIALVLGGVGGYILFRSLQQRNDYRRQIESAAFIDELTRLPNRRYLYENLNRMCEMMARYEQPFVTLFIDVDGFKPVNDRHGHDAGDEVLVEVAHRLKVCVRTSDLVARLGGDEFVVCAIHVPDRIAAENVAGKIQKAIADPIHLSAGETVVIGASIGIFGGFDPGCIESEVGMADEIVRRADAGMYVAKRAGKNRYAWAPE
ncbi:MAG: GGDEF domain-containing protein, partial [Spirochaeta sp.]|nr:GGDEF domain-containing protein [Spirochaeta sp.]